MKLSIITINWNNAEGLRKTMESVTVQSCQEFEYLVVDGGSTDGSVEVIKHFDGTPNLRWVSERDKGIYNAMNKGIRMATGEYLHFLNSGDALVDKDVVKNMLAEVEKNGHPEIMTGNLLKDYGKTITRDTNGSRDTDLWYFFVGSISHPSSYIKRDLFDKYGLYDENLKIVSDWKWFMKVIVFEKVKPVFVDLDTALFDMNGISETNLELNDNERLIVLKEMIEPNALATLFRYGKYIMTMKRLYNHKWAYKIVRVLDKITEKMDKKEGNRPVKM